MLDYNYFKKHYKIIAIDLTKQQALDANPKAIQQINFTWNLRGNNNRSMFFIIEGEKRNHLIFHKELWKYCNFILFWYNIYIKSMKKYTLNVKLSNLQLNELKSGIKSNTEVTLKLS